VPWQHIPDVVLFAMVLSMNMSIWFERRSCRQRALNGKNGVYIALFVAAGAFQAYPNPHYQAALPFMALHAMSSVLVHIGLSRLAEANSSTVTSHITVCALTSVCIGGGVLLLHAREAWAVLSWADCVLVALCLRPSYLGSSCEIWYATEGSGKVPTQLPGGFAVLLALILQTWYPTEEVAQWHWALVAIVRLGLMKQMFGYMEQNHSHLVRWMKTEHWGSQQEHTAQQDLEQRADATTSQKWPPLVAFYMQMAPFWDGLKMMLADRLALVAMQFASWASRIMPGNLKYYMHHRPIVTLPNVHTGIAYGTFPEECPTPNILQCNMGHMKDGGDWFHTNATTMKMLNSLAKGVDAEGFCGDIVSEFFIGDGEDRRIRQLNLSAWRSVEDSHRWYVGNEVHKGIVAKHYAARDSKSTTPLDSFSALLMQAESSRNRYHVRCLGCGHMNSKGYPEEKTCKKCQAPISIPLW